MYGPRPFQSVIVRWNLGFNPSGFCIQVSVQCSSLSSLRGNSYGSALKSSTNLKHWCKTADVRLTLHICREVRSSDRLFMVTRAKLL